MIASNRLNGTGSRITIMALCAAAVSAGAVARPPSGHQQMVGEGTLLYEEGLGVVELTGGTLLGMGETFDFDSGSADSKQSVTRLTQNGLPVWSYLFDWGAQTDKALEAVEFEGDLVVGGCSFRRFSFNPGADFSNRLTLMRLDQNGGVVWANRYPGGALAPNTTFTWTDLEGQVAVCVAPAPTPGRGAAPALEIVTASLHAEAQGNPVSGQFMRVDALGAVTALVRYQPPAEFMSIIMPFFAIAHDPASGDFVVGGHVLRFDAQLGIYQTDPTVVRLSADGAVQQAWRLPIQQPEAGGSPNFRSPVTTSVVMDPGGDVYAAGEFRYQVGSFIGSNTWIARLDSTTGQIAWIRQLSELEPRARSLTLNGQGELCIVGRYEERGPFNPDAFVGPAMAVVDSATGALIRARGFRPSRSGELQDGVALAAGGWQFFGSGVSSNYASAAARGGGGNGSETDLYLVRTDSTGQSGCHEGVLSIQTFDLGLQQAVGFQPIVSMPNEQELAQALTPQAVVMAGDDDCVYVRCNCFSDANGNKFTDFDDISATIANWQTNYGLGETGPGDANCDSVVNFDDINTEIAFWLNNCNPMGP